MVTLVRKTLVAGIGNIFFGDDGAGVAVAQRLRPDELPHGTVVRDTGTRGLHLAYELLDGFTSLVLIDAFESGEAPGSVTIVEPDVDGLEAAGTLDGHGMDPATVLATLAHLGGRLDRVLLVAIEPADVSERIGLSPVVEDALPTAVAAVHRALRLLDDPPIVGSASARDREV